MLRNLLVAVATYCRYNYDKTKSAFSCTIHKEAGQFNRNTIHDFLRVTENQWISWKVENGTSIGPLKIEQCTEYQEAPLSHMDVEGGLQMISRSTGQTVRIRAIPKDRPPLLAIVDSQSQILMDFLYPSKLIRRKIRFYLENANMMKTKIVQGRFH